MLEAQFIKKLSNTEVGLRKKALFIKKHGYCDAGNIGLVFSSLRM